jgi:hypothetical protein
MSKKDTYNRVFPFKIRYQTKDIADEGRLNAFEKLVERGFGDLERAIGDIYNTENATGSSLSNQALYINSLGRAIGPMSNIVPPLSGIQPFSPALASRLANATYNVIPHPDQLIKCEVGCKFDSTTSPTSTVRSCLKNRTAFYQINQGTQTGICQTTDCPDWSGRDGRQIDTSICDPNEFGQTYREYKLVVPPELRTVDTFSVAFYSNAGTNYDRYRIDKGGSSFNSSNRADPSKTWALANNLSVIISGVSDEIRYEYPNLDPNAGYIVIVEVPAITTNQMISVNGVPQAIVNGTEVEPTRVLIDLSQSTGASRLLVTTKPITIDADDIAAISQIWVVQSLPIQHRNYGQQLLIPEVLSDLPAGAEIPPNFLQLFDTSTSVNRILDKIRIFSARFEPFEATTDVRSKRDNFDVILFGDQQLEVGNSRYLAVTVGTSVATAVGALLEAFVEHVTNSDIHLSRERVCELLSNKSYCCDDRIKLEIASLDPPTRARGGSPANYTINTYIYGGFPPYVVTVDWGDGLSDVGAGIVSGVQQYLVSNNQNPDSGEPATFGPHTYASPGLYDVTFDVEDDPDIFGCTASLTSQVSPFLVGSAPDVVPQVRLDLFTAYPNFAFADFTDGYAFTETPSASWTSDPIYHILTQVHNTDDEDGKPVEYRWAFNNPNGLIFQFYYENVSGVRNEVVSIGGGTGSLANNFIQQDSLVLKVTDRVYEQNVDYTINWQTGAIAVTGSGIADTATLSADYFHYQFATVIADVSGVNQWITLGEEKSDTTINISGLTSRTDLNTIRFKVRES